MPGRTLLMPSMETAVSDETVIDISHESLMRIWTKLREWVQEESDSVKMYLRLAEAAEMYQRGTPSLWRPPDLQVAMAWAFLPTWDYIDWLKIRKAATLRNPIADWGIPGLDAKKIPLRTIFSIYGIFMLAVIARYTWRFVDILRKGPPDDDHELIDHDPKGVAIQHGDEAK